MTKVKSFAAVILLIVALVGIHRFDLYVGKLRAEYEITRPVTNWKEVPLEQLTGIVLGALFAGFRSQAADIIWWKSQKYWEEPGHWGRVWPMMRATCYLDPYFKDAWVMLGWHEAYNMAAEAETLLRHGLIPDKLPEDWVRMGLASYREGLKYNPGSAELYEDLAWTAMDKLGDQPTAAQYVWMAEMTWRRAPLETRETDRILGRMGGHAWEHVPQIDDALDAYDRLMDVYPQDHVGIGATITIRERYLPAWRAYLDGGYAKTLQLIDQRLRNDPRDKIALHLKALIQEASGDEQGAFITWVMAAWHPRDRYAHRRLAEFLRRTGWYKSMPGFAFGDLATTRLIEGYASQRGGMGVTLGTTTNAVLEEGQKISIGVPSSGPGGPKGRARVYINGFQVVEIDRPPYEFSIDVTDVPYTPDPMGEFLIHVEYTAPNLAEPAWDVRFVFLPWTAPPPSAPPQSLQEPPDLPEKQP